MNHEITLNKYVGDALLNTMRQAAFTRISELRPIAFKVGDASNVVDIGDFAEEDMTEFISSVCYHTFSATTEKDLISLTVNCNGVLRASDLSNSEIMISGDASQEILHTFSSVPVTIYFRNAAGKFFDKENENFLRSSGINTSNLVVINSRHRPITSFDVTKLCEEGQNATYRISILSKGKITEEEILKHALSAVKSDLASIEASIDQI